MFPVIFQEMYKEMETSKMQYEKLSTEEFQSYEEKIDTLTLQNSEKENHIVEIEKMNSEMKNNLESLMLQGETSLKEKENKNQEMNEYKEQIESLKKNLENAEKVSNMF